MSPHLVPTRCHTPVSVSHTSLGTRSFHRIIHARIQYHFPPIYPTAPPTKLATVPPTHSSDSATGRPFNGIIRQYHHHHAPLAVDVAGETRVVPPMRRGPVVLRDRTQVVQRGAIVPALYTRHHHQTAGCVSMQWHSVAADQIAGMAAGAVMTVAAAAVAAAPMAHRWYFLQQCARLPHDAPYRQRETASCPGAPKESRHAWICEARRVMVGLSIDRK